MEMSLSTGFAGPGSSLCMRGTDLHGFELYGVSVRLLLPEPRRWRLQMRDASGGVARCIWRVRGRICDLDVAMHGSLNLIWIWVRCCSAFLLANICKVQLVADCLCFCGLMMLSVLVCWGDNTC